MAPSGSREILSTSRWPYSRSVLFFHLVWVLVDLVPVVLIVHFGVILREERYLAAKFGQTYLDYKRKVRRWV